MASAIPKSFSAQKSRFANTRRERRDYDPVAIITKCGYSSFPHLWRMRREKQAL
jgi:hypothetical protein